MPKYELVADGRTVGSFNFDSPPTPADIRAMVGALSVGQLRKGIDFDVVEVVPSAPQYHAVYGKDGGVVITERIERVLYLDMP